MYKSLRKANEDIPSWRALSEMRSDDESSSDGFPEFYEKLRELYLQSRAIPRDSKKIEDSEGTTVTAAREEEEEEKEEEEEEADIAMKLEPDESESATPKPAGTLSKSPKSLKAASSSISILSKISSSEAHTSDDGTSSPPAMGLDRSRHKRTAPCHLPTVLVPSMEPLRALRHRKWTTMEARIALLESARSAEHKSDDEYRDDVKSFLAAARTPEKKSQQERVDGKSDEVVGKEDASLKTPKILMKVRSEQWLMPLTIAESPARGEKLKRSYSCASIGDLSRDPTRGTLGAPRGEAGSGRDEAISSEAVDSGSVPSGSIGARFERRPELPLSTVAEISRFLAGANLEGAGLAANALESLADEFSARLTKQGDAGKTMTVAAMRRAKLAAKLAKLLAESKRYLSPEKFPSDLVFSAQQPPVFNTRLLRRVLPLESYNLIAPLLGMQTWYPKRRIRRRKVHKEEEEDKEDVESVPTNLSIVVRIRDAMCRGLSNSIDEFGIKLAFCDENLHVIVKR